MIKLSEYSRENRSAVIYDNEIEYVVEMFTDDKMQKRKTYERMKPAYDDAELWAYCGL